MTEKLLRQDNKANTNAPMLANKKGTVFGKIAGIIALVATLGLPGCAHNPYENPVPNDAPSASSSDYPWQSVKDKFGFLNCPQVLRQQRSYIFGAIFGCNMLRFNAPLPEEVFYCMTKKE